MAVELRDDVLEGGYPIEDHYGVFVDSSGARTFAEVRELNFEPGGDGVPSYGFSRSTYWFRFEVNNPGQTSASWLLEVGYPHLDHVDLYSPGPNGTYESSTTGDRLPFAQRELAYRNFVFRIDTPPGLSTYYMRVASSGPVTVPLTAWSGEGFVVAIFQRAPMLWMFYGLMCAMAVYNLFLFFAIQDRRYLIYVAYIVSYVMFQFTLNGLSYQYLWPESPDWANRFIALSIGVAFLCGVYFSRLFIESAAHFPRFDRVYGIATMSGAILTVVVSQVAPVWMSIRVAVLVGIGSVTFILPASIYLAAKGQRQARYYLVAWGVLLTGILLYLLKSIGVVPANSFSEWTIQIGAAIEVLLLSLGLADRIHVLRQEIGRANADLEVNVERLTGALQEAEASRKAKSAFLASVSHELRTPLNAIINIPEGLLEDFHPCVRARCGSCESLFELDEGETLTQETRCPECAVASLSAENGLSYEGDPQATRDHLEHVRRAGRHLLRVVSDILDISKLEAGRMTVTLRPVRLEALMEEVLAPMRTMARNQGVELDYQPAGAGLMVCADDVKLQQVVLNLVSNAIKFSDGRGTVRVVVQEEPESCLIAVHDQGTGIAETDKHKLFEAFVQAESEGNRRFGGTGLGLAISKSLVESHHGEIWFESELGRGTDFYVRIPRAMAEADAPHPSPSVLPPSHREVHG